MTKKISPDFLRQFFVLTIFFISLNFFSQSDVYINVNWIQYSGENKIEIINSSNSVVLSLDHNYGVGSDTEYLNQNSSTVSLPDGNYTVRVYDNYGDDWNGSGSYAKVFVESTEEFNFNGDFTNNAGANTEIHLDYSLTIGSIDDASFSYASSSYAQDSSDPTPTITGESGGAFSSTSGLSINASTGLVDVSASTIGAYTITYTTTAPDQNSATFSMSITAGSTPGVAEYFSNNNSFSNNIEYIPGNLPIIISAPHGGKNLDGNLTTRSCDNNVEDDNTDILIRVIQKEIFELTGGYPHIIINNLSRSKLDPNRKRSTATCGFAATEPYFDAYHGFIDKASAKVTADYGKGIYIDLHGQSHTPKRIDVGFNISTGTLDAGSLSNSITTSTIENLKNNNINNFDLQNLVRGSQSFGHFLQTTGGAFYNSTNSGTYQQCSRTVGYRAVPSAYNSGGCDDTTPNGSAYFAGDYYSNIRHGSGPAASEGSGVTIGGGGTIDGMMTEVNRDVRHLGNLTAEYNRNDNKPQTIVPFGKDYAASILKFIEAHYNNFSKFSFNETSYSTYGLDATPTIEGISGGVFSSTTGLSINTTTGIIDVSASTPGLYTINYIGSGVNSYYKKENQVTINNNAVTNVFTASSGNWSSTSNWSIARLPIENDNISIPSGRTVNLDLEDIKVTDISVVGTLNVNSGKSITVKGNLTNTGTLKIDSDATTSGSIIVEGNSSGNIVYNRYIKDNTNWYLISSPVENQDIDLFASGSSLALGSDDNRGLSNYNNSTPSWEYYQLNTINSGDFELGKGYSIKRLSAGNVTFTGGVKTNFVNKSVSVGTNGWNLIGNPYPSFISVNNPADNTNNLLNLSSNFSILETGYKAIYYWDTVSSTYKPINNLSAAKYLAPGQGYFVKVNANGNVTLNENMQSHQNGNHFLRSSSDRFEIKLKINIGDSEKNTDIKYVSGATTGLDEGYDAGLFNASSTAFSLYTNLVTDNDGTKFALQALPNSNYNTMIVPVGLNASKESEINFSADIINIPTGIKVYLEDKVENNFTRIDKDNVSYTTTLLEDVSGIGRFYIHTTSEVLSVKSLISDSKIKIYKTDANLIKVTGLNDENTTFKLFSILGKEVLNRSLNNKKVQEVTLPKLNSGIYFVQIESESGKVRKKIILE